MKLSPSTPGVSTTSHGSAAESTKDSAGIPRAAESAKSASALVTGASAQVDLRSSRINDFSDAAWINEPPALDTAMLDQIKSAIREGRFVINEQAIARALSEDASR
jgi:anti-sigma28 factor (negative regulator of flagellin synthesis)